MSSRVKVDKIPQEILLQMLPNGPEEFFHYVKGEYLAATLERTRINKIAEYLIKNTDIIDMDLAYSGSVFIEEVGNIAPADEAESEAEAEEPVEAETTPAGEAESEAETEEPVDEEAAPAGEAESEAETEEPVEAETATADEAESEAEAEEPVEAEVAPADEAESEAETEEPVEAEVAPADEAESEAETEEPVEAETATADDTEIEATAEKTTGAETDFIEDKLKSTFDRISENSGCDQFIVLVATECLKQSGGERIQSFVSGVKKAVEGYPNKSALANSQFPTHLRSNYSYHLKKMDLTLGEFMERLVMYIINKYNSVENEEIPDGENSSEKTTSEARDEPEAEEPPVEDTPVTEEASETEESCEVNASETRNAPEAEEPPVEDIPVTEAKTTETVMLNITESDEKKVDITEQILQNSNMSLELFYEQPINTRVRILFEMMTEDIELDKGDKDFILLIFQEAITRRDVSKFENIYVGAMRHKKDCEMDAYVARMHCSQIIESFCGEKISVADFFEIFQEKLLTSKEYARIR